MDVIPPRIRGELRAARRILSRVVKNIKTLQKRMPKFGIELGFDGETVRTYEVTDFGVTGTKYWEMDLDKAIRQADHVLHDKGGLGHKIERFEKMLDRVVKLRDHLRSVDGRPNARARRRAHGIWKRSLKPFLLKGSSRVSERQEVDDLLVDLEELCKDGRFDRAMEVTDRVEELAEKLLEQWRAQYEHWKKRLSTLKGLQAVLGENPAAVWQLASWGQAPVVIEEPEGPDGESPDGGDAHAEIDGDMPVRDMVRTAERLIDVPDSVLEFEYEDEDGRIVEVRAHPVKLKKSRRGDPVLQAIDLKRNKKRHYVLTFVV